MLCLHVVRMLWANFHHPKQFGANLGSFWCKMAPQPKFPSGLANSLEHTAMRPWLFAACELWGGGISKEPFRETPDRYVKVLTRIRREGAIDAISVRSLSGLRSSASQCGKKARLAL